MQLLWLGCAVVALLILIVLVGFIWLAKLYRDEKTDPLRKLRGLEAPFFDSLADEVIGANQVQHNEWVEALGKTFKFNGFGKFDYRLVTSDLRALSYILNSPIYEKPWQTQRLLSSFLGRGIGIMEGKEHARLRRIVAPAFSNTNVRRLYAPVFAEKAAQLCEVWENAILSDEKKQPELDVSHWLNRATLDVIGLASFDHDFDGLRNDNQQIFKAYKEMFEQFIKGKLIDVIIQIYCPWITKFWKTNVSQIFQKNMKIIYTFGESVIQNKKRLVSAASSQGLSEKNGFGSDLLSRLLEANINSSLDPSQRLTDKEILDQINNFLFAGSDSSALAMCWCLDFLAHHPTIQTQLREEVRSMTRGSDMEEYTAALETLPYLDSVVKETLRLSSPVHSTIRAPVQDDMIPLSEELALADGTVVREIKVRKGTYIHIPLEAFNIDKAMWGEDATEFKPERWSTLSSEAKSHPGLGGVLSFSFGPHSCPGWKFALTEIKVFIAALVSQFVFTPCEEIQRVNVILQRPYVQYKWEEGCKLPLKVELYAQ
ncbi:hypothetical protein M422DRAFT_29941 [Sphaerobolus stellatus SS14]|uniref:Cytochrome P450 n=1 Tax=Sphaerobolus stellatus (strain SS14) TaxID=990650 RepID=A0A0C9VRP7_SPHS4|nr:hypothetical protein M422DRAFT_29941 [Sphaerobolus stellatus SS14]